MSYQFESSVRETERSSNYHSTSRRGVQEGQRLQEPTNLHWEAVRRSIIIDGRDDF